MKVTVHLDIDAKSLFKVLKEMLLADISEARGKKAKPSNVHEGYSYKKYLRGKGDPQHAATVRIEAFDVPRTYRSTVTTAQGVNTLCYEVVPAEGGGIDVTYEETFEGASASASFMQKTIGALRSGSSKSRIKSQLHAIEAQVRADRFVEEAEEEIGREKKTK